MPRAILCQKTPHALFPCSFVILPARSFFSLSETKVLFLRNMERLERSMFHKPPHRGVMETGIREHHTSHMCEKSMLWSEQYISVVHGFDSKNVIRSSWFWIMLSKIWLKISSVSKMAHWDHQLTAHKIKTEIFIVQKYRRGCVPSFLF